MVLGAGSTSILESNNSLVRLDEHRRNLTKVRAELENIAQYGGTQVLWALEAPVDWERLNGTRRGRGLTNEALGRYNSEANKVSKKTLCDYVSITNGQVFHESRVTVWSSVHSLAEGSMGGSRDGFHMSDIATSKVMISS